MMWEGKFQNGYLPEGRNILIGEYDFNLYEGQFDQKFWCCGKGISQNNNGKVYDGEF